MKTEFLFKWTQSPSPYRRKKAISKLTAICMNNKSVLTNFLMVLNRLIEDEDERVRVEAYNALAKIALKYSETAEETLNKLIRKFGSETPISKATIIKGIREIVLTNFSLFSDDIKELIREAVLSEDINIKLVALNFLEDLIDLDSQYVIDNTDIIMSLARIDNINVRVKALNVLKSITDLLPEEKPSEIHELVLSAINDQSYLVRTSALSVLRKLVMSKKVGIDNELIKLIRKKLRDRHVPVKTEALRLVFALTDNNLSIIDDFLDIISNEYLLVEKNKNLKIMVLEYLYEKISNIPTDIIHKHKLPRVLDIIEKNTVRKNKKLATIKDLARNILEEKLGYTFELRKNLAKI